MVCATHYLILLYIKTLFSLEPSIMTHLSIVDITLRPPGKQTFIYATSIQHESDNPCVYFVDIILSLLITTDREGLRGSLQQATDFFQSQ